MATFFMFGKYSSEAVEGISAKRSEQSVELMKKFGGEIKSMYALMGDNDLVLIVDLPGIKEAIKASVALSRMTGVAFSTSPALSVEEFDKMMGEM